MEEILDYMDNADRVRTGVVNGEDETLGMDIEGQTRPGFVFRNSRAFSSLGQQWSIFKVPAHVREVDDGAYNPKVVAIGPIHFKEPGLKAMEAQKSRFLARMLEQTSAQNCTHDSLVSAMTALEGDARGCYLDDFEDITSDDFVSMMILDGCFIVELLRLNKERSQGERVDDPIFATRWMLPNIGRDLLMLENQLPFFVLQKIFNLTRSSDEEETSLNMLAIQFLEPFRPGKDVLEIENFDADRNYNHLLALFQSSMSPSIHHPSPPVWDKPHKSSILNAKRLRGAGVVFGCKPGNSLDIEFTHRSLKIPTFYIDDGNTIVLRNLLAYEQSDKYATPYISSLVAFLYNLVGTQADAAVLRQAGIIKLANPGGDQEVESFIISLAKELAFDADNSCIAKPVLDIEKYCQSRSAQLKICLSSVLSKINITAFLLLYLSIVQTILSAMYVQPSQTPTPPAASPPAASPSPL